MFHVLKHIMHGGAVIEPGATIDGLSDDQVENLKREGCIETPAAHEARKRLADVKARAEAEAAGVIEKAEREAKDAPTEDADASDHPTETKAQRKAREKAEREAKDAPQS